MENESLQDYNEVDRKRMAILRVIKHINRFKHGKTDHSKFPEVYYYCVSALKFL